MNTPTREQVLEILKQIQDPELKRDIVALGMIKDLKLDENGLVDVELGLVSASGPLVDRLCTEIHQKLKTLKGVEEVKVRVTKLAPKNPSFSSKQPVEGIRHVVAVASGKGGVGKTTVAVNLALALAGQGLRVGLMDGDIYGPNVPLMLGIPNDRRPDVNEEEKIVPLQAQGISIISMGVLVPQDQPMVWRGPMLHSAITQFVQKVAWGALDFLLVDLPPGTGDVQLSLVQTVPLTGAVIVTTPQEVALMDVRKGVAMFRKTEVPILGVIENMTGEIFGRGGGRNAAVQFQVPFLAEIPLDRRIREGGDAGLPIVLSAKESEAARAFVSAAEMLEAAVCQAEKSHGG